MTDEKKNKCKGPNCSCTVGHDSKYCSPHCETMKDSLEIACECGHAGCAGEVN